MSTPCSRSSFACPAKAVARAAIEAGVGVSVGIIARRLGVPVGLGRGRRGVCWLGREAGDSSISRIRDVGKWRTGPRAATSGNAMPLCRPQHREGGELWRDPSGAMYSTVRFRAHFGASQGARDDKKEHSPIWSSL